MIRDLASIAIVMTKIKMIRGKNVYKIMFFNVSKPKFSLKGFFTIEYIEMLRYLTKNINIA